MEQHESVVAILTVLLKIKQIAIFPKVANWKGLVMTLIQYLFWKWRNYIIRIVNSVILFMPAFILQNL